MAILEVKGFSGGLTDDEKSTNPKEFVEGDNLNIEFPSEDLITREGSEIYNDAEPNPTTERVSNLINMGSDDELLAVSNGKLFVDEGAGGINELLGEGGNSAFPNATTDMIASYAEHDGHLYIVSDDDDQDGVKPVKVYKDDSGDLKLVTAGLPKFEAVDPYDGDTTVDADIATLANDIRTQFLDHYADTTRHPGGADVVSSAIIASGALTGGVSTLAQTIALVSQLMKAYRSHYADAVKETGSRAYHSNSLGDYAGVPNVPLKYTDDPKTFLDCAKILNDLKLKHNWHMRAYKGHPSVGPDVVTASSVSESSGPLLSTPNYSEIISFVNALKSKFNIHVADLLKTHSINFLGYTLETISLADATDYDSARELAAHIYAAYRLHHDDVAEIVIVSGSTDNVDLNKIKNIAAYDSDSGSGVSTNGSIANIEVGMTLFKRSDLFGSANAFASGTTVTAVDTSTGVVTLSADHNAAGASGVHVWAFVSASRHYPASYYEPELSPDKETGKLTEIDISSMMESLDVLLSTLNEIKSKYNTHDDEGGVFTPTATPGSYTFDDVTWHFGGGFNQFTEKDLPSASKKYIYAFVFSREYITSNDETVKDISATHLVSYEALKSPEQAPVSITGIPSVTNTAEDNYDTANIKVEIYRTLDSQTVPRLVGKISNGTTTFTDNMSDEELESQEAIYTTGGVVDNDPPPIAKVIHVHRGFGYYGNLKVGDEYFPNRIGQSIAEDLDSVPESFFVDLPLPVIGISSTPRDVVAWTKAGTYRLEGTFDERGHGAIIAIPISDTIGLMGGLSPVQIDQGVVFAGNDGFYFTDAYAVRPISPKFSTTYMALVQNATRARRLQGTYDKINNRVYWTAASGGDECDALFVLHLDWGLRQDGGSFTTWSGGTSFKPSAIAMFNNELIRGDSRGYIFRHDSSIKSDPVVDTLTDPSLWTTQKITYDYKSPFFDFGTKNIKKWVTKFVGFFRNLGQTNIQIFRTNDLGKSTKQLKLIKFDGVASGALIEKRWMPAGNLRCTNMQVRLTNTDDGTASDKTGISQYSLQYELLGDSHSDAGDEA